MKRKHIILVFSALLLAAVLLVTQALAADYWICSGCGKRVSELVGDMCPYCGYERHVHDWVPATCVSPKTCQTCGETEGKPDPANHTDRTEVRNQCEATCEEAGYTGDTCCAACGQVLAQGREIPAAGHRWESVRVIREATCIEQGLQECVCTVCGRTEERVLPMDPAMHAGATELRDSRPATCGAAGYTGDTYCLDCGKKGDSGPRASYDGPARLASGDVYRAENLPGLRHDRWCPGGASMGRWQGDPSGDLPGRRRDPVYLRCLRGDPDGNSAGEPGSAQLGWRQRPLCGDLYGGRCGTVHLYCLRRDRCQDPADGPGKPCGWAGGPGCPGGVL